MKPLEQILAEADQQKVAVGHFNISDLVALKAVYSAARELNVPVLVGVSEGERDFIGVHEIAALIRSIREQDGFPVYLNADHTHSIEKAREAAQAGFDLVVFDCSALPFEENVTKSKQAVTEMKSIQGNCARKISPGRHSPAGHPRAYKCALLGPAIHETILSPDPGSKRRRRHPRPARGRSDAQVRQDLIRHPGLKPMLFVYITSQFDALHKNIIHQRAAFRGVPTSPIS